MEKNIIPQLSENISIHKINKNDFFIHQKQYDHRIKITSEIKDFLALIDNKKYLVQIIEEYNFKYHSNLEIDFIHHFLFTKLAKYGIIKSQNVSVLESKEPSYLKLNFIVFNKKRVALVTRYLQFLFHDRNIKLFSILSVLLILFSIYTFKTEILEVGVPKSSWLHLFLLSFIGVTFHEFGHASAAHYYGAEHGGIGGGFYLFMPVYFADVTDIWKLSKKERIIVNFGGIYFELIYVALLLTAGFILNYKELIVLPCIFSFSILYNLYPFSRTDGYWILSDLIEKPNLMKNGWLKVKDFFSGRKKSKWKTIDYIVFIYGIISCLFLIYFVYFMVIKNPESVIYFPRNVYCFVEKIFTKSAKFSLYEIGNLILPLLFSYMVIGFVYSIIKKK